MKRLLFTFLSIFLILPIVQGCATNTKETKDQPQLLTKISYKMYFQGFIALDGHRLPPLGKVMVFTKEDDWKTFSQNYFSEGERVASMSQSIDWKSQDLIYWGTMGSKFGYTNLTPLTGYTIDHHQIQIEFKPVNNQANQILAINNFGEESNVAIISTVWTLVKKKDVPVDAKNFWK